MQTQIRLAALGIKKDITERQTAHGIKDKLAEHWIKILLDRAHTEHQRRITNPATADERLRGVRGSERAELVVKIKKEVQQDLLDWLVTQPPASYAKLAQDSRRWPLSRTAPQILMLPLQHFALSCVQENISIRYSF